MNDIDNLLEDREKYLKTLKKKVEKRLLKAPDGTLRICKHGNRWQYYHRKDTKDKYGSYIQDKNVSIAQKLAQKSYDEKVLGATEKELEAIEKYKIKLPDYKVEDIYEKLNPGRQELIIPIKETDEQFVLEWENEQYQGNGFQMGSSEFYTNKGERVRSKSEVIIADALAREGIPYKYEYPLYLDSFHCVYPDFTILRIKDRKEILWEHLGKMDDEEYAEKNIRKINDYQNNGYLPGENLILTYETYNTPINQKIIHTLIQHYFKS